MKGKRKSSPRKGTIKVVVRRSEETIDIDAWCERYVAFCLELARRELSVAEDASERAELRVPDRRKVSRRPKAATQ